MTSMPPRPLQLAVIGAASCGTDLESLAADTGREVARAGAILLSGGRGGVMAAAARGATEAGGTTVGILPGTDHFDSPPNPYSRIVLFTGLGQARNQVLVLSAHAVLGIGGGWGTLNEIGLALKYGVPVVLQHSWDLQVPDGLDARRLMTADSPRLAVAKAIEAASHRRSP